MKWPVKRLRALEEGRKRWYIHRYIHRVRFGDGGSGGRIWPWIVFVLMLQLQISECMSRNI
jgi:hypothetical protein